MSKITRMQRSYAWQPHLPFMPSNLPNDPWAERYRFKYDTLPIVRTPNGWTLELETLKKWGSHVGFFKEILMGWRGYFAQAPMSVNWVPHIYDKDLQVFCDTEKKARGYYWYYRTLIFNMFAEFSYVIARRYDWVEEVVKEYQKKGQAVRDWARTTNRVLGDFYYTKRAGVVVEVATSTLLQIVDRYLHNGVPVLMDVGHVVFRDHDKNPTHPLLHITNTSAIKHYSKEWPDQVALYNNAQKFIKENFPWRVSDFTPRRPLAPLVIDRPPVGEAGGVVHQRRATTPWVNPLNNQPTELIRVAQPEPVAVDDKQRKTGSTWVDFFARRREINERIRERETPVDVQRRESRTKEAEKINATHTSGPSRKMAVFRWVQDETPPTDLGMNEAWIPSWKRVRVERKEIDDYWVDYLPSQRLYDPFHNEWDLLTLLDVNPPDPTEDFHDDNDDDPNDPDNMYLASKPVESNSQPVAYLDQINAGDPQAPDPAIIRLSSQIALGLGLGVRVRVRG